MNEERLCAACYKPLVQGINESARKFAIRETCGADCGGILRSRRRLAKVPQSRAPEVYVPWPQITGTFIGSFVGMDVQPADDFVAKVVRPDRRSYVGCAAARCAE